MNKSTIGQKIKLLRIANGITQAKLAELVDMHEKHISRIEAGRYCPNVDNLSKIFKALGASLKEIDTPQEKFSKESILKIKLTKLINNATESELIFYEQTLSQLKKSLASYKKSLK